MNTEFLNKLLAAKTPSGHEVNAKNVILNNLNESGTPYKVEFNDKAKNLCVSYGNENAIHRIMLSAHIDEIALQVQHIDDKGFIHFITDGGIDKKVLLGATVTILSDKGEINGIIGKKPIHVEYDEKENEKDKATEIKDMKIDVGAESKAEALEMGISIGDYITIRDIPMQLGLNRFSGRGLDDKVGVYVAFEAFKQLAKLGLKNTEIYAVACTQEETSATGAVVSAAKINPTISIDYDVTFATDDDYVSPNEWGDIKLGKGGAIAYGPDSNKELSKFVKNTCEKDGIPYQEFSVFSGATDTVHIKQSSEDAMTILLSIPNRNMHTQVEVCDYRDLDSLVAMTVNTILRIDNGEFNNELN